MAAFTVSTEFIENAGYKYYNSILFQLSNSDNCNKLAVDNEKNILKRYINAANEKYREIISTWLAFLSNNYNAIEIINVSIENIDDNENACLEICAHTNGPKNLIISSLQNFSKKIDGDKIIYNNNEIKIWIEDEASEEINKKNIITITNSIVAKGDIINSSNNIKKSII